MSYAYNDGYEVVSTANIDAIYIGRIEFKLYDATTPESHITAISEQRPRPRLRQWAILREIFDLLLLIGAIYALVNLATVRFIVDGSSMEPNFSDGQFLIISRVNYVIGDPQRGDIVVFHFPGDTEQDYIKRVIGLPGETVEIRDTQVYINGVMLEEPYINEPCNPQNSSCGDASWELGNDEYFMMGDNRNHSRDSRSSAVGPVRREFFVGEVLVRYWPPPDWGIVSRIAYSD